jgi:predicted RNA binding protein YcfA (HicA-like mRNA interferase family)
MAPGVSRRELIRRFRALGFEGPFSGGRHQFMVKGRKKIRIPNPHGRGDIHIGLISEILKQAGLTLEEWDQTGR